MTHQDKMQQLKNDLYSDDHRKAMHASNELAKIGGQDIIDLFISLLDQDNSKMRDIAALGLHDIADNQALEPLLTAINKQSNKNSNGTMAFALETLDCSRKLNEIFNLLFCGNVEVKMAATSILDNQDFYFTNFDLTNIQANWDYIKSHPDKCPLYDSYKETIEYFIEMYVKGKKQSKACS